MKRAALLLICFLLMLGLVSFAQDDAEDSITAGTGHAEKYLAAKDRLGLTGDQVAKLEQIRSDQQKKIAELNKMRNETSKQIRELMKAEEVDMAEVETRVSHLERVRSQLMLARLNATTDARKVLTQEQLKRFKTAKKVQKKNPMIKERINVK